MGGWGLRVSSCLKNRLERLWCGWLYWVALRSVRGRLSVRKRRRKAGKCDSLSFLRVSLCLNYRIPAEEQFALRWRRTGRNRSAPTACVWMHSNVPFRGAKIGTIHTISFPNYC